MDNIKVTSYVLYISTRASGRGFYPIFNKTFDHLETLMTIHRPKNVLSAGSLYAPRGPSYYPKSVMLQFQICCHSHLNVS